MTAPARRNPVRALVEIEPGRPAFAAGLRMTVTIVGPVIAGIAVDNLAGGFMSAIAALNVGLTERRQPVHAPPPAHEHGERGSRRVRARGDPGRLVDASV